VDTKNLSVAREIFGMPESLFTVVHNGVASIGFRHRQPSRRDPLRIGHVGVVDDGKGWRFTAEAVRDLWRRGIPAIYTVAGTGPEESQARRWCETNREFAVFRGYVQDTATRIMPDLDVLCLPSRTEGMPMALLEALAAGVVIIATSVGGIPEIIENGVHGFLVSRDSGEITVSLEKLATDRVLLRRMSVASSERFNSHFRAEIMGERYDEVYLHATI
jgi:glycosyltransferase involved in cell wall biosynthesis